MNEYTNEEWRDVPGYEGYYQASSLGRIKSLRRVVMRSNGVPQTFQERIMCPACDSYGYQQVRLSGKRDRLLHLVHKVVAITFIGEPPSDDYEINHIDGNKTNNSVNNLEWVSHLENVAHGVRLGLFKKSEAYKQARRKGYSE